MELRYFKEECSGIVTWGNDWVASSIYKRIWPASHWFDMHIYIYFTSPSYFWEWILCTKFFSSLVTKLYIKCAMPLNFYYAMQVLSQESAGMLHYLTGGAWDPHDFNSVSLTSDSSVQLWDLRTMKYVNFIPCTCI